MLKITEEIRRKTQIEVDAVLAKTAESLDWTRIPDSDYVRMLELANAINTVSNKSIQLEKDIYNECTK